jgi:uncharacterized protein with FMN-binding domain
MPIRGTVAVIATVICIALMANFKTPAVGNTHPAGQPVAIGSPPPSGGSTSSSSGDTTSSSSSSSSSGSGYRDGSYDGQDYPNEFGDVQVRVVVKGGRVSDVQPLQMPSDRERSALISQEAGPLLHDEVVQAQSAQIDTIGGATFTSESYAQSVQSALDKARG